MFEAGKWYQEIILSLNFYQTVHAFLTDRSALKKHLDSWEVIEGSDEGVKYRPLEAASKFALHIQSTVERGEQLYNKQMVVIAATYIELILNDYLSVLFRYFPLRMYEYLYAHKKEEHKGVVSLKEIVKAKELDELLKSLSDKATANALKGRPFATRISNLEKITKKKVPGDLKSQLTALVERRNGIVHEAPQEEVTEEEVRGVLDTCLELIRFLALASNESSIPLDEYYLFNL
jgi:hypothetical protein